MFHSFKNRLIAFTVSLIIILAFTMTLLCYAFFYKTMISTSIRYNDQLSHQLCANIDFFMSGIEEIATNASYSPELRFYNGHFVTPGVATTKDNVKKALWSYLSQDSAIDDISCIYNGSKCLSLFSMYDESSLLELCKYYDSSKILSEAHFVPLIHKNNNNHPALSCIKSVTYSGMDRNGFIIFSILIDDIFKLLEEVDLGANSGVCLLDSNGTVQYSTLTIGTFEEDMNQLISEKDFHTKNSFISQLNNEKYILSVNPLSDWNLSTVVYVPLRNVTGFLGPLLLTVLCSLAVLLAFFLTISILLASKLTSPVMTLAQYIKASDNYTEPENLPYIPGTAETDFLYHAFGDMMSNIRYLIKKNEMENKAKREAEIMSLQSQINPHFLYNTLDSINALAILENNNKISRMVTSLAKLLRFSISQPNEFVSIQEEISHVKAYLTIQNIRYDDKFIVHYDIDKNVLALPIIRLILQPFVENCIYHGLEKKDGTGNIFISAHLLGDHIEIVIKDDGVGIAEADVTKINAALCTAETPGKNRSVGIYNVNKRLRLYYGDKSCIFFDSGIDQGTAVTIRIPSERGEA